MTTWSDEELGTVGGAEELQISSRRPDGSLRPYVTIWAVRAGDDIYVRSAHGPENGWFRRAKASGAGRIRAGGLERDVTFTGADPAATDAIDQVYRDKYRAFSDQYVDPVVDAKAAGATIRILPAEG